MPTEAAGDVKSTAPADKVLSNESMVKFLEDVAETGKSTIPWTDAQPALLKYFEGAIREKIRAYQDDDEKPLKVGVDVEKCYKKVYKKIESLTGFPATFRRICALLTNPRRTYAKVPTLMSALVKVVDAEPIIPPNPEEKSDAPKVEEEGDETEEVLYFNEEWLKKPRAKKAKRTATDTVERGPSKQRKEDGDSEDTVPETPKQEDANPGEAVMPDENNNDAENASLPDLAPKNTVAEDSKLEMTAISEETKPKPEDASLPEIAPEKPVPKDSKPEEAVILDAANSNKSGNESKPEDASPVEAAPANPSDENKDGAVANLAPEIPHDEDEDIGSDEFFDAVEHKDSEPEQAMESDGDNRE
ncbi:hypothetical protein ANCCEY_00411 [Ancylostoma ceylanicum]|nr:hypothetical protein ANCCEY_00411 [Ancylostoma ceylanicum]